MRRSVIQMERARCGNWVAETLSEKVTSFDYLNDTERKAFMLADNPVALDGAWNEDLPAQELAARASEKSPVVVSRRGLKET